LKSDESDLLELALLVYDDACAKCAVDVSDFRDRIVIRSRFEHEGISFFTITLPSFSRAFERSLELGVIDSIGFRSFRKLRAIPAFLQGMLSRLFDVETGRLLYGPFAPNCFSSDIVEAVRQICRCFNKLELQCAPERVAEAIEGFVQTERDLKVYRAAGKAYTDFISVSALLWTSVVSGVEPDSLWPTHGPGATADGRTGNRKYRWMTWHERLEPYFPFLENGYSVSASTSKEFQFTTFVPSCQELPVKVTPVPKTLKGPRIIAIEPCCMQYTQQAIRRELYARIESSRIAGGHVSFTDQTINRKLALIASSDRRFSTIDMSEASDRVPHALAMRMFDSNPFLRGAIIASRSTHAKLPNGAIIGPLRKFASMGSALCFPIEAMYFYTSCVVALLEIRNLPVNYENCYRVSRDVYVYGDDLIIPSDETEAVLGYLQKYNCKVNVHKTFYRGFFRESCGMDAYQGYDVTPVYVRQPSPKNRWQARSVISWFATANLFYRKGYWRTADFIFRKLESVVGFVPYVGDDSAGLGRISFLGFRSANRWNRKLQRLEVTALVPEEARRTDELSGYAALQKCLLSLKTAYPINSDRIDAFYEGRQRRSLGAVLPESKDRHWLESTMLRGVATLKRRGVPV